MRFDKNDNFDTSQKLERIIVNAKSHFPVISTILPFHESIDKELAIHESVVKFIND